MDRRKFVAAGVTSVGVIATAALPGATAAAGGGIVGSYLGTVTATNPPLGQFNDLISFHDGGVVTESRRYLVKPTPLGNLLETSGHGAWEKTGGDTYEAFFRFFIQDADTGAPIGTDNVSLSLTLDKQAGTLSGRYLLRDTHHRVTGPLTRDSSDARRRR